ncbi:MAG: M16 family metallopeptidase [Limisphaerales bacterium]
MYLHRTKAPKAPLSPSTPIATSIPPTTLHTLANGLQIIVREDHSAPVVATQAWCRTGSIHEGRWLGAGLSHVLEHMLFKGTKKRTGPRLDQEVTEAGGYFNAYTSYDRTVYWINTPETGASTAIDVLADIMQNATLPADELVSELDVIRREMDMGHDDPGHRASRRLFETAFAHSPCRHPIIGHRELFDQLTAGDIHAYYQQRYAPNNLFFVVVGDVEEAQVIDQISKAFANARPVSLPPTFLPAEPRQISARERIEEANIALGHMHLSWHTPDSRHADAPALDILTTLLGAGRSSRLYQRIREKLGLVHSADAWTYSPGHTGILGISAIIDGQRHAKATQALLAEATLLQEKPVSRSELAKAKKLFMAAALSTRKTMQGQAQDLGGSWLMADDFNFSEKYLQHLIATTADDIQRAARTYLRQDGLTHYALLPTGSKPASQHKQSGHATQAPQLTTLSNGLRVIVKEDHRLPFVDLRWVTLGGVLRESTEDNGITHLMTRCLLKGTRNRSAKQIALEIESVGGHLETYGANNSFGVQLEVLKQDFPLGASLLADVLLNPKFPAPEVKREQEVQLAAIRAREDQLLKSAVRLLREKLFGPSGYGLDSLGKTSSVKTLTPNHLRAALKDWLDPSQSVLAVAGDITVDEACKTLEKALKPMRTKATPEPALQTRPPSPGNTGIQHILEQRQKRQAVVVVGFPGTTLKHEHRFPLEIIQEACSDLGSRLFLRIRDKLGLAYYVGAQQFAGLLPGYFAFYAGTSPDKAARVEKEILKEAANLARNGLTKQELERVKAKILGQKKIGRQDLGHLALGLALDELYGLGFTFSQTEDARYQSVTLQEVKEVAKLYLNPERAVVVTLTGSETADQNENS